MVGRDDGEVLSRGEPPFVEQSGQASQDKAPILSHRTELVTHPYEFCQNCQIATKMVNFEGPFTFGPFGQFLTAGRRR